MAVALMGDWQVAIKLKAVKLNGEGVLVEGCVACACGAGRFRLIAAVEILELVASKPPPNSAVGMSNVWQ